MRRSRAKRCSSEPSPRTPRRAVCRRRSAPNTRAGASAKRRHTAMESAGEHAATVAERGYGRPVRGARRVARRSERRESERRRAAAALRSAGRAARRCSHAKSNRDGSPNSATSCSKAFTYPRQEVRLLSAGRASEQQGEQAWIGHGWLVCSLRGCARSAPRAAPAPHAEVAPLASGHANGPNFDQLRPPETT